MIFQKVKNTLSITVDGAEFLTARNIEFYVKEEKIMKKYAYIDRQGIMRIVSKEETAKQYSKNGKVATTELTDKNGVPSMFNKATRVEAEVWVFAVGEAYFEPRQRQGEELRVKKYPELLDIFLLYRALM